MKYNTKNYDYLIVGAGPFGTTFAHEAANEGKGRLLLKSALMLEGIPILIRKMVLMFTIMVLIFFTLIIKWFGIM